MAPYIIHNAIWIPADEGASGIYPLLQLYQKSDAAVLKSFSLSSLLTSSLVKSAQVDHILSFILKLFITVNIITAVDVLIIIKSERPDCTNGVNWSLLKFLYNSPVWQHL